MEISKAFLEWYNKNYHFNLRLAAMLFSIFATLALAKLNPRHWLQWYLDSCAAAGGQVPADIQGFLPWNLTAQQRTALSKAPDRPDVSAAADSQAHQPDTS